MASSQAASGGISNGTTNGAAAETAPEPSPSAPKPRRAERSTRTDTSETPRERSPLNSLGPSRPRARSAREESQAQNGVRADATAETRGRAQEKERRTQPPGQPDADTWAIPDSVKHRFTQNGHHWYFPDGARAFRDRGRRLTTPSENTEVVASLIEIATARSWNSITVRGTERFRQEAWKQGKLVGLEVRGYRANDAERAAMIRALSRRADDSRPQDFALRPPPDELARAERPSSAKKDSSAARRDEPMSGKLLDHGTEHYEFDPKADFSYFVRIETAQGKRVIWGTDFQRALKESLSQAQIGDQVIIQHRGSAPVTVMRRELDQKGKILSQTEVGTRRNSWSIERADFLAQRENAANALRDRALSPQRAVQKHPELAGTLLQVKAAELAARRFSDPRDRETFVTTVRNALADEVARGEPLRPVRLKQSRERRTEPERDHAPTR
jgi:hypothetical protein